MGEQWAADLRADGVDEAVIAASRRDQPHTYDHGGRARCRVVCAWTIWTSTQTHARQAAERTMAVQSVALACQNLLLAAHAHGLGACWMCAPLFAPELVRDTLASAGSHGSRRR